jgi:hypothetical protein
MIMHKDFKQFIETVKHGNGSAVFLLYWYNDGSNIYSPNVMGKLMEQTPALAI